MEPSKAQCAHCTQQARPTPSLSHQERDQHTPLHRGQAHNHQLAIWPALDGVGQLGESRHLALHGGGREVNGAHQWGEATTSWDSYLMDARTLMMMQQEGDEKGSQCGRDAGSGRNVVDTARARQAKGRYGTAACARACATGEASSKVSRGCGRRVPTIFGGWSRKIPHRRRSPRARASATNRKAQLLASLAACALRKGASKTLHGSGVTASETSVPSRPPNLCPQWPGGGDASRAVTPSPSLSVPEESPVYLLTALKSFLRHRIGLPVLCRLQKN